MQVEHNRTVHSERQPYACDKCERKFTSRTGLLYHTKHNHDEHAGGQSDEGDGDEQYLQTNFLIWFLISASCERV